MRGVMLLLVVTGSAVAGGAVQAEPWQWERAGQSYWDPWGYRGSRLAYGGTYRRSYGYPRYSWSYRGLGDWSPGTAARVQRFELRQNLQDRWLRHRLGQEEAYRRDYGGPSARGPWGR